jgi:hypothetical protein
MLVLAIVILAGMLLVGVAIESLKIRDNRYYTKERRELIRELKKYEDRRD